jgi:hypothetical protein
MILGLFKFHELLPGPRDRQGGMELESLLTEHCLMIDFTRSVQNHN